jgi:hypothetical protein
MSNITLTDEQWAWLQKKVPYEMYKKYNRELGDQAHILTSICANRSYTEYERDMLNKLRSEYIEWKNNGI